MDDLTYKLEVRGDRYCIVFSDGVVLEKESRFVGKINSLTLSPMSLTSFKRPDDKWTAYSLLSNGKIKKYTLTRCTCLLPREKTGLSPVDYEMYILLFQNWIKKGKITLHPDNELDFQKVIEQFSELKCNWLNDTMIHKFICKECNDELILELDTYRGGGKGFYRKETINK